MKTNPSARGIRKIRRVLQGVALAVIAGLEIYLGASLAARTGQITGRQMDGPLPPNVSISDLLGAAR